MDTYVQIMIASCVPCQYTATLIPVDHPNGPWEKVGIDITGPFEHAIWDCRYVLTLTDYYSKWPEVAFAPTVNTEVIIQFLTTVFSWEGNFSYIVSDNGCQLPSHAFAKTKGR